MRICLAWAPSSGKSSVANWLELQGFQVFNEPATIIINQKKSDLLESLWLSSDNEQNVNKVLWIIFWEGERLQSEIHAFKLEQWKLAKSLDGKIFFDTGFVEDVAQRRYRWLLQWIDEVIADAKSNRYNKIFFMTHPWIIENNQVRIENYDEVMWLQKAMEDAYQELWYETSIEFIKVPTFIWKWVQLNQEIINQAISDRIEFILSSC